MTASASATPELHELNRAFTWERPHGPFTQLTETQVEHYDRHGYLVVESLFEPHEVAAVREAIDRREARVETSLQGLEDQRFGIAEAGAITFTIQIAHRDEVLRRFVTDPRLLGLCHDLVGPDVDLYWDQAVYKKPEKPRRFPWHQDNGYTFVEPQCYLTCWVALTDATLDNGCPVVAPGLHRGGTYRHDYVTPLGWQIFDDPPIAEAAPVGAGGVVVFSSLTPHMTGPNLTDAVRKAYIVQYSPAGARIVSDDGQAIDRPVLGQGHTFAVLRDGHPAGE